MRITGLRIENWRSIHRLELSFEERLTVIHGPNEAGKSTVQEAIRCALLAEASSNARELRELVPWGSSAKAHVELTLETRSGELLRIEKGFPAGEARLYLRRTDGSGDGSGDAPGARGAPEALLAEGREVQGKIFSYLGIPAEASDLFGLLWIGQGESLALFDTRGGAVGGPAQTLVKSIIKENLLSGRAEQLYQELLREWGGIFQRRNGRPRKGSRRYELEERAEELERRRSSADELLEGREAKAAELEAVEGELERLEKRVSTETNLLGLFESKQEEAARLEPMVQSLDRLEEDRRRLLSLEAAERETAVALPRLVEEGSAALGRWRERLEERRGRAAELRAELERVRAARESATVKERAAVEALEVAARRSREARLRLEAAGLEVAVRRRGGDEVGLSLSRDGGEVEEVRLEGEGRWRAARSLTLAFDSGLEVECSGPLSREEWRRLAEEIEREERELAAGLEVAGCATLEEAKEAYARYLEAEREESRLGGELAALVGSTEGGLEAEVAEADRIAEELDRGRVKAAALGGGSAGNGGTAEAGETARPAGTAGTARSAGSAAPAGASGSEGDGPRLAPGGRAADRGGRSGAERVRSTLTKLQVALQGVEEGRRHHAQLLGGRTREELTHELYSLREEVEHRRGTIAAMEPAELESVSLDDVKKKRNELEELSRERSRLAERRSALRAELAATNGLVEERERLERELAGVQRELEGERRRTDALGLLIRLIEEEREALDRNIVVPLEERLTEALRSLAGGRYEGVRITEGLGIGTISALGLEAPTEVEVGSLSYGTREQLSFLFRLLVARYLSDREPQVMMLDDTFVNTDAERRERLVEMMMSEQQEMQFILFTCHGEHYGNLRGRNGIAIVDLMRIPR